MTNARPGSSPKPLDRRVSYGFTGQKQMEESSSADARCGNEQVRGDGEKLGELRVSKGTLDWAPMSAKIPVRMTWEQFDRFMRER